MKAPFINIHTHFDRSNSETIAIKNIFPGESFAAFSGRNFFSVGLHPWHLKNPEENNEMLRMVEEALEFDHVIMVGECGLDKIVSADYNEQLRVFEAQAIMAEEYDYPLIIHCVKSYNEILEIYKKLRPHMPWILHGYNGSIELTKQLLDNGFLFSFGEKLLQQKSKAVEAFCYIPVEKIFLETDEMEYRVEAVYKTAAELRGIGLDELKAIIMENFAKIENSLINKS